MRKWWKCLRFGILHVNVLILLMESSWSCWTLWTLSVYGPSLSHLPACKLKIEHRWSSPIWWKSHWVQCPQGPATQMTPLCYNVLNCKQAWWWCESTAALSFILLGPDTPLNVICGHNMGVQACMMMGFHSRLLAGSFWGIEHLAELKIAKISVFPWFRSG